MTIQDNDHSLFHTKWLLFITTIFITIIILLAMSPVTEDEPTVCHTDEWYQEAFIEAWESGDSFSFYKGDQEYTFTPKYE